MTGISIFDPSRIAALLLGLALSANAADISLIGSGKLSGEILAMDGKGTITLSSPVSAKPLLLNGDKVKQVDFGKKADEAKVPDQRVKLVNGDILPLRVESLDDISVSAVSEDFGKISIPRELVDSIQLGIVPEKLVYKSIGSLDGWKGDAGGARNWTVDGGVFLATGQGTLSRDFKLPDKFVIRFNFAWDSHPNFRMFFAEPDKGANERANRYYLQFANSGLEIRRESMGKSRYTPIVLLSRTPEQFPGRRIKIEMRVDRTRGLFHLYVNGELEGRYTDPIPGIPDGNRISLLSLAPQESEQSVSNFEILEWDDRGDRHRTEDRGDPKLDALIGRFGERFGGHLDAVRGSDEGTVYLFKSDFQKDPIELPEQEVSTVFLAGGKRKAVADADGGLVLRLRGGGELRATSCEFGEKVVTVTHPLLGAIELAREAVTRLERRSIPKAKVVENP